MSVKNVCKYILVALILTPSVRTSRMTEASSALPLGTLSLNNGGNPVACPAGANFYSQMTCYSATVSGCKDYSGRTIAVLNLTFGITPLGTNPANGVIVLHAGLFGEHALSLPGATNDLAADYYSAGFRVVQVAWGNEWEFLGNGDYDTKGAACRPATFFNYIYNNYYVPISGQSNKPGYCLLGGSAGAAAVGMYLVHYGGGNQVDKAEMYAGPQFGDVEQGCEIPAAANVTVCPGGSGAYPCAPGVTTWSYPPAYQNFTVYRWVGGGTNNGTNAACSNTHGINTSSNNQGWKNMSIVDGLSSDSSFNYPDTDVSAYLCAYGTDGGNGGSEVNPSSEQGWIFFSQLPLGSVKGLVVHSATCWSSLGGSVPDAEAVEFADEIDNSFIPPNFGAYTCNHASYSTGYAAMCNDMINSCFLNH